MSSQLSRRGFLQAAGAAMMTLAAAGCRLRPQATAPTADLYVSPEGDDGWSGTLPAPNRQGSDGPLGTLAGARDRVRQLDPNVLVTVMLRGGIYYLDEAVIFSERDSRSDTSPAIYRAYPGEVPELVGGQPVTGWVPHTDTIWKAQVDAGRVFHTLFENGVRAAIARHPNEGYAKVHASRPNAWQTRLGFDPHDVPAGLELRQLQVYLWPGGEGGEWNWFSDILNVAALDYESQTLSLAAPASYAIGAGSRYFIQGDLSLLDAAGEFFLDEATSTLYYWPRKTPIEAQEIIAPTTRRVIACIGRAPEALLGGLAFDGLTLRVSDTVQQTGTLSADDGLVVLDSAAGVRVERCYITNTGLHGILMNGAVRGCTVAGCEIDDVGHTGVQINAPWVSAAMISADNIITGNHIHHTGKVIGHGAGIQLVNSGRNTLTHNLVHHTSRYAVSLKSPRPGMIAGSTIDGVAVTRENAKDFAHSRENEIAYNDLSHANLDSQDTGVFESWGGGLGNRVHHNRIHDSDIPFSFGFGLYLDDAADGFEVTANLLHHLQRTRDARGMLNAAFMIKGVGNVLNRNVAADNTALAAVRTYEMADEGNRDLVFRRNIFSNSGLVMYDFTNWSEDRIAEADDNVFYLVHGTPKIASVAPGLTGWQARGYDTRALITDPGFVDPAAVDYRLRPDAAARTLGITSIPVADIGLPAGFRYADDAEPLARLFVRLLSPPAASDPDAETWVVLTPEQTATLEVLGRSTTGFLVDLRDAAVTFSSAGPAVASVTAQGEVQAHAPGLVPITVTVTRSEVTLQTVFFVVCNAPD